MSPRKMRLVIDLIRGKSVDEAYSLLRFCKKAAAGPIAKTLRSAVSNAQQKAGQDDRVVDADDLYVRQAYVNEGSTSKRWRARARGSASPIMRRTSHVTIVLDERNGR